MMADLKLLAFQCVFFTSCLIGHIFCGYIITTPRVYRDGTVQRLNVHLHGNDNIWNITTLLKISRNNKIISKATKAIPGNSQGFMGIQVPHDVAVRYNEFNNIYVEVLGVSQDGKHEFKNKQSLTLEKPVNDLFIQIEKSIYKPGQTVRIRVIGVKRDLKPLTGKVERIFASDPKGIRMMQWDDIDFNNGIANVEMVLSKQPVLGDWKVQANNQGKNAIKSFEIKKYVKPKFTVDIEAPLVLFLDSKVLNGTICARYLHGQLVSGEMKAVIEIYHHKTVAINKKIKGCFKFSFTNEELGLDKLLKTNFNTMMYIKANVTEEITGITQASLVKRVGIQTSDHEISFDAGTPKYFKRGSLPFFGQLEVVTQRKLASNKFVNIKAQDDNDKILFEKNFTVSSRIVNFEIAEIPPSTKWIGLSAYLWSRKNNIINFHVAHLPWYSPSSSFLTLKMTSKLFKFGETGSISFIYSVDKSETNSDFNYQLVCGGNIVDTGRKRLPYIRRIKSTVAEGSVEFSATQSLVSSCRFLLYYVRQDGEVVADSMILKVQKTLRNKVVVRFNKNRRSPGESVQIITTAAPGSIVALSAVDKSLQKETQDINIDTVSSFLSSQDVGPTDKYKKKKRCYQDKGDEDASKSFYDTGLIYMSDSIIESRPCLPFPTQKPYLIIWKEQLLEQEQLVKQQLEKKKLEDSRCVWGCQRIRMSLYLRHGRSIDRHLQKAKTNNPMLQQGKLRFVPETWLWTDETISNITGERIITAKVPDSMTSWQLSAFAMSSSHGMGIAKPATLTVFRPFFVSAELPFAVIRGEKVSIVTTVFSYMTTCTTILIQLRNTSQFQLISTNDQRLCNCGNEAKSVKHVIKASELGQIPFTVTVKNVAPSVCKNPSDEPSLGISDTVSRVLLVEPEGEPREYTYSELMCPTNVRYKDEITLDLPKDVIPGSVYATVSITGDVMGPTLKGFEKIVKLPTGCGEQNMVNFAPNVYVIKYLNSTDLIVDNILNKVKGFLQTGYQRELTYKRQDGSYSAFGDRDEEGSLWLTAFVLRSFSQASQFVFIDDEEIQSITGWVESKQLANGCFEKHGTLLRKELKGGVSTSVTLTAYVLISLLESNVNPKSNVIVKALKCILNQQSSVTDSYSNAIIAYALTLANHPDRAKFLTRLASQAIIKDGKMHWEKEENPLPEKPTTDGWVQPFHRSSSINIEMTGYALLAMIGDGTDSKALFIARPVVKWLSNQRNAHGGFSSTQDTCVALQALSVYGRYVYGELMDYMKLHAGHRHPKNWMTVHVSDKKDFLHRFSVSQKNRLVLQRIQVPSKLLPMKLSVLAIGKGCALIQADVSFSIKPVISGTSFRLSSIVGLRKDIKPKALKTDAGEQLCHPLEINVCAQWLEANQSGMAVIEIKLVSGFRPDEESLERLMDRANIGLMRFEIEDSKVVFYFNEIKKVCVTFGIDQTSVVQNMQPASATVYEYYDTDKSGSSMYTITDKLCQSSNVL